MSAFAPLVGAKRTSMSDAKLSPIYEVPSPRWPAWHQCNTLTKIVVGTHRFTDHVPLPW
jgi:hypothetical protein